MNSRNSDKTMQYYRFTYISLVYMLTTQYNNKRNGSVSTVVAHGINKAHGIIILPSIIKIII